MRHWDGEGTGGCNGEAASVAKHVGTGLGMEWNWDGRARGRWAQEGIRHWDGEGTGDGNGVGTERASM